MRTQAHYIQSSPPQRQNTHINLQLIKNNSQAPLSRRVTSISPNNTIYSGGMNFYPIQMVMGSSNNQNNISVGQPKPLVNLQTNYNLQGNKNYIVAPTPTNVTKIEKVNRSNSSSRVNSQHSRVQYINVNGESNMNINSNQQRLPVMQIPQNINKNIAPIIARPISNLSSQSRNSTQIRPISPLPTGLIHSKSQDKFRTQVIPHLHSQNITNMPYTVYSINSQQQQIKKVSILNLKNQQINQKSYQQNQTSQHRIMPNSPPTNNNMHTSQVKIVYQRGSYSPNQQNSQSSSSRNIIINDRPVSPPAIIKNQYKMQPQIQIQQIKPALQNLEIKKDKITIADLKQKKDIQTTANKAGIITQNTNNYLRLNGNKIKSTAVQSIIVDQPKQRNFIPISNKQSIEIKRQTYQIQNLPNNIDVNTNTNMTNNKMMIQSSPLNNKINIAQYNSLASNQLKQQKILKNASKYRQNQIQQSKIKIIEKPHSLIKLQQKSQLYPILNTKQPQILDSMSSKNNYSINSNTNKQSTIKSIQYRNNVNIINSQSAQVNYPKKIYKSYDQYLQQTRKPQKLIEQIQQSQLQTAINIQYRQVQKKTVTNNKTNNNINNNNTNTNNNNNISNNNNNMDIKLSQQNIEQQVKIDEGYGNKSIPIPTIYGYTSIIDDNNSSNQIIDQNKYKLKVHLSLKDKQNQNDNNNNDNDNNNNDNGNNDNNGNQGYKITRTQSNDVSRYNSSQNKSSLLMLGQGQIQTSNIIKHHYQQKNIDQLLQQQQQQQQNQQSIQNNTNNKQSSKSNKQFLTISSIKNSNKTTSKSINKTQNYYDGDDIIQSPILKSNNKTNNNTNTNANNNTTNNANYNVNTNININNNTNTNPALIYANNNNNPAIQTNNNNNQIPPSTTTNNKSIQNNKNKDIQHISTIREHTPQYDNQQYQYQYSSSLIGSSLQDNLRNVGNSGRLISDYQPDSWVKQSQNYQKIGGVFNAGNSNIGNSNIGNIGNVGSVGSRNKSISNNSNTLNFNFVQNISNSSLQVQSQNKISPFAMIQSQNNDKINTNNNINNNNPINNTNNNTNNSINNINANKNIINTNINPNINTNNNTFNNYNHLQKPQQYIPYQQKNPSPSPSLPLPPQILQPLPQFNAYNNYHPYNNINMNMNSINSMNSMNSINTNNMYGNYGYNYNYPQITPIINNKIQPLNIQQNNNKQINNNKNNGSSIQQVIQKYLFNFVSNPNFNENNNLNIANPNINSNITNPNININNSITNPNINNSTNTYVNNQNSKDDNLLGSGYAYRRQDNNTQSKYQVSTIDRINSQKVITNSPVDNIIMPISSTQTKIPLQSNSYTNQQLLSFRASTNNQNQIHQHHHSNSLNNNYSHAHHTHHNHHNHQNQHINTTLAQIRKRKSKQIQNQQQQYQQHIHTHTHTQMQMNGQQSIDVYDLIDDIYNRQLQNGLARIREVFGHVVNIGNRGTY